MKKILLAIALAAGLTSFTGNAHARLDDPFFEGRDVSSSSIPEPSTYALFGIGALALVVAYRRKVA